MIRHLALIGRNTNAPLLAETGTTRIFENKVKPFIQVSGHRKPIYVIAEMACSHEGDPNRGQKIIEAAADAQADAVQFQIWLAKDVMVPHHPDFDKLKRIELSREAWTELAQHGRARRSQMEIIACVYERGSVDFAEDLKVDAYKLHSADLSNPSLVKYVAQTGKRIDLSIGASTLTEIQTAIDWIRGASDSNIWLMYGYQNFPTRTDDVHLDYMMKLRNVFELPIGYQDHSNAETGAAFWLPAAAAGMGVEILEKHITHDRAFKGIDHEAALNPDEFARFVRMVREIEAARGIAIPKSFSPDEQKYRKYSKKSIVASRPLPKGSVVKESDLIFMRAPELGLPPDRSEVVIGRSTKRDIPAYELVVEHDLT